MTATAVNRKVNFSPGPAVLPVEVLEEARENILSLGNTGVGVMEHSHRGKPFVSVLEEAEANVREVIGVSDDYAVLFLTGGASTQFFQVPMNFLQGGTADYLETGAWSTKALKEAARFGTANVAASSKDRNHTYIPTGAQYTKGSRYTHFTSNNTIFGTQWRSEPEGAESPLVCDASSDICSRPIDISKYGILYAGAQKNLGPAGVTLVIIRRDLAEQGPDDIPTILQYRSQIKADSCYNTCPTFPIFMLGLTFKWLKKQGGLGSIQQHNEDKAGILYGELDSSDFYSTPVEKDSRSLMNVVWRLPNEDLEKKFIADASAAGFDGLKGHRSVGGIRASIYNAMTKDGVQGLVDFMRDWNRVNG